MQHIEYLEPKEPVTAAMGAYSHGIKIPLPGADLIFLTGQKSMDSDMKLVHPGDPEKQTIYVFENIKKILAEAGATINHIVKSQIFVTNMDDFPVISKIRNQYFAEALPVSTLVEVNKLSLEGALVEIAVTAVVFK